MIKNNFNHAFRQQQNGRKDSYESTTSSAGSHNFRSTNDVNKQHIKINTLKIKLTNFYLVKQQLDPTTATVEKSPHKYKLLTECNQQFYYSLNMSSNFLNLLAKVRKSVRKINNLKLLGLLKVKDTQATEQKTDADIFKKIFKVTQKGLNYDNHQYYLTLNATVMNNHLIRQASPIERLKVNLYDDERTTQPTQSTQATTYTQDTPLNQAQQQMLFGTSQSIQMNLNSNNNNLKKRVAFRRRSCYCNQTGKQSQKSLKVDFLLPSNLIKNRIYQRMKKKQDMKMNLNEKDLIIQNLNRTFDIDKNSARGSAMNSPNLLNNLQQQFNFLENATPQSGKSARGNNTPSANSRANNQLHIHSSQAQRSQFSYITSPKNQNSNQGTATNKKKEEKQNGMVTPVSRNPNSKPTFAETIQYIKEEQNQSPSKNQTPLSTNDKKQQQSSHKRESSDNFIFTNSRTKDSDLMLSRTQTRKNHSSNKNSPKNSNMATASPNRQTPNSNKSSVFFNNNTSQYQSSAFGNNFLTVGGKTMKDEQQQRQSYESIYPIQTEKRRKWLAKLRMATKLVGIQEKQRKKSFLYHQDYYKALEEVANNQEEQEHKEENVSNDSQNQEKKFVLVRKVKNDQNARNAQMFNQIITQHNLKFNSTITNFVDKRAKSYNTLLPQSSFSIPTISAISQKQKRQHLVSPFNSESQTDFSNRFDNHRNGSKMDRIDAYLKPLPVIHSPSPKSKSVQKKTNEKNPLLMFQSYSKKKNNNKDSQNRKLNETDKLSSAYRAGSHKQINSTTLTDSNHKHILSMTGFSQPNKTPINYHGQLNNSQESLEEFQLHNIEAKNQEASKSSLGQASNNEKSNNQQKSQNEISSLDQLGRYETYYSKQQQPKMSQTTTYFKPQTKTQQKFELLLNSSSMKNSYLFKTPNSTSKPNNILQLQTNKSMNSSKINFRNSSQPDLLQSTFKNDLSSISSNHQFHVKTPSQQSNNRPNYLQAKFENKGNRKSIIQSYMV